MRLRTLFTALLVTLAAPALLPAAPDVVPATTDRPTTFAMPKSFEAPVADADTIARLINTHGEDLLVINFWATYCGPCLREMPYFQEAYAKHRNNGVVVVGLSTDKMIFDDWADLVPRKLREVGARYPNFVIDVDPDIMIPAFSQDWTGAQPATFYFDRNGNKLGEDLGELTRDEVHARIAALLEKAKAR